MKELGGASYTALLDLNWRKQWEAKSTRKNKAKRTRLG